MSDTYTLQQAYDDTRKRDQQSPWDAPFQQWQKTRSPGDLRRVVRAAEPVIQNAVTQYAGAKGSPIVKQRARLLAAKAIQDFDPQRGASLKTHVHNQLRALQRMAPAVVDPFSPSEHFRRQQVEIQSTIAAVQDELGREPTDEEIADVTSLPVKRIRKVRSRMRARIPSSVYDASAEDDESPDIADEEVTDEGLWLDAVYHDLGEIDRMIMAHRTGYRDMEILSNTEIARRLNISPAAVSQRAARIQHRLDEFYAPAR